jgi:hypothetical protein
MAVAIPLYSAALGKGRDLHTTGDRDADDGAVPRVGVAMTLVIVGGGIASGWTITAHTTTPQG